MANFNRQLLVTYSEVFGSEFNSNNLSALDKSTWAKIIARFNHLARTQNNYSVKDVLTDWFGEDNNDAANEYCNKIIKSYSKLKVKSNDLKIINIWSNLTLLDKIMKSDLDSGEKLSDSESEKILFENYLATNDLFTRKSDKIFDKISQHDYPNIVDRMARITLTTLLPYHELNHFKAIELFIIQFIKTFYLFKFLEQSYSPLLRKFLDSYGVNDWNDYLVSILPIAHMASMPSDFGLNYLNLEESTNKDKSKKFLDKLSLIQENKYSNAIDFLHARSCPLFKVEEDKYLILDSVLAVNRVYNSIFYELLKIANEDESFNLQNDKLFGVYTFEFIEKYLCYELLNKIFKKRGYVSISGKEISDVFNVDTEPDYYVRNGNKIFLFEIKGSIVTGKAKQSFNFDFIEKELKDKFLFDTKNGKKKAIKQLAERTKNLLEKSNKAIFDKEYRAKNIRVFPVLLVSELSMTTPGINHLLNEWFKKEIEQDDVLHKNKHRIYDLVIIDIDTLISFSDEFEKNTRLFEELLCSYIYKCGLERVESLKRKSNSDLGLLEARIMSTIESFGFYIKNELKPSTPEIYKQFANELFNKE